MAPEPISQSYLRGLAQRDDLEVRLRTEEGGNRQVEVVSGTWGHRLVRDITKLFREADKATEYIDAKRAVLDTLKTMYGEDIAVRAFRANIGRMDGNRHLTSAYHPITGQHIGRMLEQADREILEKYARPENGGVDFGRRWCAADGGPIPGVPDPATRDWMLRRTIGLPGPDLRSPPILEPRQQIDRRGIDLRSVEVRIQNIGRLDNFGRIAESIFHDAEERLRRNPGEQGFWTLDLRMDHGHPLPSTHTLGLRIDPDDPEQVNVFDVNRGEVRVRREDLGAWLKAHVTANYGSPQISLYRAEQTIDSVFTHREDGRWTRRASTRFDGDEVSERLFMNINLMPTAREQMSGLEVSPKFMVDVDRMQPGVKLSGRDYILRTGNVGEVLPALVGGGSEQENRNATYNLSLLLNQNLLNLAGDLAGQWIIDETGTEMPTPWPGKDNIVLSRDGDVVRIDVDFLQPLRAVPKPGKEPGNVAESDKVAPPSGSSIRYSIEIPLSELRRDGGFRSARVSDLSVQMQLWPRLPDNPEPSNRINNVTFFAVDGSHQSLMFNAGETLGEVLRSAPDYTVVGVGDDRLVLDEGFRAAMQGLSVGQQPLPRHELFIDTGDGQTPLTPEALLDLPLSGEGLTHLSVLASPSSQDRLAAAILSSLTRGQLPPEGHAQVIIRPGKLPDGQAILDIEFRHEIPDGLLKPPAVEVYYHGNQEPDGPGIVESRVAIRVTVSELNGGIPQDYDLLGRARLVRQPIAEEHRG